MEQADAEQGLAANHLLRLGLAIFFTMNVMVFSMALWSQSVYPEVSANAQFAFALRNVFRWASLVFSLPVLWLLGKPILLGVQRSIRNRSITTDLLIVIGVSAAFVYSTISVIRGTGHVYFEVGSMVLVFVSLGRLLEAKGKLRTGEALDRLAKLLPDTVRLLLPTGRFKEVRRETVRAGDVLRVLAGQRIPLDGIIISGEAHIDQQMVTGESKHTVNKVGDTVYGGTLNIDGDLRVQVSVENGQETLSRMINLIRTARSQKGRQEQLADRIVRWFIPTVCLIAVGTAWQQMKVNGIDHGILTGLSVALIACPCALGLATPMAIWAALGRAAECGVLFRSGRVLEKMADVRYACFDKTGTLTKTRPAAIRLLLADEQEESEFLSVANSVAACSSHQLSESILEFANKSQELKSVPSVERVTTVPGKGLLATLPVLGEVSLGSKRLMKESDMQLPSTIHNAVEEDDCSQVVFIGWAGQVRGAFCFAEQPRPEAAEALLSCRQMGIEVQMLTGDTAQSATALQQLLGLSGISEQLPEDKYSTISALSRNGPVALVGDGLNDAPALAMADVGVALGCGADVSRDAAGVCLLADDLRRFPWAVELATETSRVVRQNLFWAFAYNTGGIALAVTGNLNPVWAALAMAVSSLLVIANSLRLGHYGDSLSETETNERVVQQSEEFGEARHRMSHLRTTAQAIAKVGS